MKSKLVFIVILVSMLSVTAVVVGTQTPKPRATAAAASMVQQPLYTDFRGVRLGMTAPEARVKLGDPVLKDQEMDYFILSDTLTAQVAYDTAHKVKAISVDYAGGTGAPDYRNVVGTDLETRPDGSSYKVVRYESLGFWVSYNRTAGPTIIVTITIQKI